MTCFTVFVFFFFLSSKYLSHNPNSLIEKKPPDIGILMDVDYVKTKKNFKTNVDLLYFFPSATNRNIYVPVIFFFL